MPPSRLPIPSDFPQALRPVIHSPNPISISNLVIFLHGLGDTSSNFSAFAAALNLPETLHLTLQAPFPLPSPALPIDDSRLDHYYYHWGDDVLLDSGSGEIKLDAGFCKTAALLSEDVVEEILISKCGFRPGEILIVGSGQGGMAGLAIARALGAERELGGVVSIGGPIPSSCMLVNGPRIKTPVLLLGGARGSIWKSGGVARAKGTFENVEHVEWRREGDGMPRNREETLPMMKFLAGRLKSRRGVPAGSVEVG